MSEYLNTTNGVEQGGVLSPLLVSVYADELLSRVKKSVWMYAKTYFLWSTWICRWYLHDNPYTMHYGVCVKSVHHMQKDFIWSSTPQGISQSVIGKMA